MVKLYNTRTKQIEDFRPINPQQVGLYSCGPTVYNYVHIGNLRTYVFVDTLKRVLKYNKFNVMHVMNITDVGHLTDDADQGEDKIEKGSKREGKTAWDIVQQYTDAFKDHIHQLNILDPNVWAAATDHIQEQIDSVQTLIDNGCTYETTDGIYFDTTKIDNYGSLAQLDKQELKAGARIDMGEKKNPHDFALWKFTKPGESRQMEWDAFGKKGFPGWHIECSSMSTKYLGNHFDIHTGGIDLIPVHHTNEIAQSEAITGKKPWVNFWLHGEFLLSENEKDESGRMAKSSGNFITLDTITEKGISPLAYRYFLLQAHYRRQLSFSWEALEAANQGLKRLKQAVANITPNMQTNLKLEREFLDAINDDLNTAEALAVLWRGIKEKSLSLESISKFDKILGLRLRHIEAEEKIDIPDEVSQLLSQRETARKNKDWESSDSLRDDIADLGFLVSDTDDGQIVSKQ